MNTFPKVKVTYKGQALTARFFDENPNIHSLYPNKEIFLKELYIPLFEEQKKSGIKQVLEISENSIRINGTQYFLKKNN